MMYHQVSKQSHHGVDWLFKSLPSSSFPKQNTTGSDSFIRLPSISAEFLQVDNRRGGGALIEVIDNLLRWDHRERVSVSMAASLTSQLTQWLARQAKASGMPSGAGL